jgi:GT2 family glycosyltransferase
MSSSAPTILQRVGGWLQSGPLLGAWHRMAVFGHPGRGERTMPEGAYVVGARVYVPAWWPVRRPRLRLTVLDPRLGSLPKVVRAWLRRQRPGGIVERSLGRLPDFAPYADVTVRVVPGRWQTVEFMLSAPPAAGADVHVEVDLDTICAAGVASRLGLRVKGIWLRGDRLRERDVTIVVLNWKRARDTIACLESLAVADLRGAAVMVVDNGSHDGSVEAVRERFPDQRVLCLAENRGYSGGNNAGIRAALADGAKAVLVLNNDTRVAPDFLGPLVWMLNSDVTVAAVSSAVLRPEYEAMLESAYLEVYWGHGIIRHYGVNALPGEGFGYHRDVDVIVGCSILLSADALNDIGSLDESYFAYHEEVDWCFRARAAGYRICWQPYSRVWHNKSTSTAGLGPTATGVRARPSGPQLPATVPLTWNPVQTYLGARNAVRFIRRHAGLRRKLYFALSSAYGVPLEFLAAVMRQESALKIGAWSYRNALALYCANPDGLDDPPPASAWVKVRRLPYVLFRALPRDVRIARQEGRLAQVEEHVHGLWDGILGRPLPLERLGLR